MADFKTHVTVAAALSVPLAASAFIMELATIQEAALYALAGTLGGMLPDIDADESVAIRIVFRLFAGLVAGLILVTWVNHILHWQLLLAALAGYLVVRFPIQWVFEQLTVHRGTLHSLLANIFFSLITVPVTHHLLGLSAKVAWGTGAFVLFGAMIHLILDELYSIELSGMRVKRSFGTALKLTDWGQPLASIVLLLGCVLGYWASPEASAWQAAYAWLPDTQVVSDWVVQEWQALR